MDRTNSLRPFRIGMITTFPPTRCGIARFSADLTDAVGEVAPETKLDIIRLVSGPPTSVANLVPPTGPVAEIDPESSVGIRAASRILNRCDVAVVQHEFGIFGDDDGAAVVTLTDQIRVPIVTVLHTVRPEPTAAQRRIVDHLADRGVLVVMCESARRTLEKSYGVSRNRVEVIHHGAHWSASSPNRSPRRRVITWGLMGPGKGIERAIAAMAELRDLEPSPGYLIVGRTHPVVFANHGPAYRQSLQDLVVEHGLEGIVRFVDRYVEDDELRSLVAASDVVLVPYDNTEQMSSGVITEALGVGRPVVATRFPYAAEMLGDGSGIVVDHDPGSLAHATRTLLEDGDRYQAAADAARLRSPGLSWRASAEKYVRLMRRVAMARASA